MKIASKKPSMFFTPPEYLKTTQKFFNSSKHYTLSHEDYKKLLDTIHAIENASRSIHQLSYIFRESPNTSVFLIGFEQEFAKYLSSHINNDTKTNHTDIQALQNRLLQLKIDMKSSYPALIAGLSVVNELVNATIGILGVGLGVGIAATGSPPLILLGLVFVLFSSIMALGSLHKASLGIRYCSGSQTNEISDALDRLKLRETDSHCNKNDPSQKHNDTP